MKITKRRLRRIIRESLQLETTSYEQEVGEPSEFIEANWISWAEENDLDPLRGVIFDDLARFLGAPDRSWLDAKPPAPGDTRPSAEQTRDFVKMKVGYREMQRNMRRHAKETAGPERKWD